MKPDWKDAPEWAQWLAQDPDGDWYWYSQKPGCGDCFYALGGQDELAATGDWRESLEPRP